MAAVGIIIRRIAIEKAFRRVTACDNPEGIGAFDLSFLKTNCKLFSESFTLVADFLTGRIFCNVITP